MYTCKYICGGTHFKLNIPAHASCWNTVIFQITMNAPVTPAYMEEIATTSSEVTTVLAIAHGKGISVTPVSRAWRLPAGYHNVVTSVTDQFRENNFGLAFQTSLLYRQHTERSYLTLTISCMISLYRND